MKTSLKYHVAQGQLAQWSAHQKGYYCCCHQFWL